jgi:signal transduction histidine kinase
LEHAQLYREAQRREEFSVASAAVTAALLEEDEEGALALATERVHDVLLADSVFLALLDEEDGQLNVVAVSGQDPDSRYNTAVPLQGSLLQRVLEEGRPTRIDERSQRDLHIPTTRSYGPIMALPLTAADRFLGGLVVARAPGARSFVETELTAAADFADRTSVALELHRARADQGRMRIFEDRGRIARDLHDRVIQQLFATGMQLQGVLGTLPAGQNADRVDAAVASLDGSIAQIRRIIFTLSSSSSAPAAGWRSTSRHRLLELVGELTSSLAVEPTITFRGPVDALLDPELTEDVLAVVSEGVTNAVKHGAATEIAVSVVAAPTGITVIVTSNGEPVPSSAIAGEGRRSGLANLEERAQRRGGVLRVRNVEGRPTMEWRVPPQPTR